MPRHPPCALFCLTSVRCIALHLSLSRFWIDCLLELYKLSFILWFVCFSDVLNISLKNFQLSLCMKFSRYILNSFAVQWRRWDSNSWPPACKAGALPTELHPHWLSPLFKKAFASSFFLIRQPPAFPCRLQHSIIGRLSLNHRVRDVDGCFP